MTSFAVDIDPNRVTPGALGFFMFVALGVALFFLVRSMNKHLRKVPLSFDEPRRGDVRRRPDGRPSGDDPGGSTRGR